MKIPVWYNNDLMMAGFKRDKIVILHDFHDLTLHGIHVLIELM